MDKRYLLYVVMGIMCVSLVSGCGTAKKKPQADEVTAIKTRVDTLESKVEGIEAKQSETEKATQEQGQAVDDMWTAREGGGKTNIGAKSRGGPRMKEIQACLKKAGVYDGAVDGVKGKGTTKAIKGFQKSNGLKADGVVGRKTWELLRKYKE